MNLKTTLLALPLSLATSFPLLAAVTTVPGQHHAHHHRHHAEAPRKAGAPGAEAREKKHVDARPSQAKHEQAERDDD